MGDQNIYFKINCNLSTSLFILGNILHLLRCHVLGSLCLSPFDKLSVFIVISGEMINGGRYQVTMNTL